MADKTINDLPVSSGMSDDALLPVWQNNQTQSIKGQLIRQFAQTAAEGVVDPYVAEAAEYAQQAEQSAQSAASSAASVGTSATQAAQSAIAAQNAQQAAESAKTDAQSAAQTAAAAVDDVQGYANTASSAAASAQGYASSAQSAQQAAESASASAIQAATIAQSSAESAQQDALSASGYAGTAQQNAASAQSAASAAATSAIAAGEAQEAIENMIVDAITLETGQPASVSKSLVDEIVKLTFGLPRGDKGETGDIGAEGVGIVSITLTSGNHAPGTSDTYTITLSDDSTFEFLVYNGTNGAGAGDFLADGTVPMTGALQMNNNRITGVAEPTQDSDAARKADLVASNITFGDGQTFQQKYDSGELTGAKGDPGPAATIEIGTVTTGEAGTSATVTNSGTSSAAVFNFTIPRGAKGDKGDKGDTGPAGADGAQGPAGAAGADGKSAYEYAVDAGYAGTEADLSAALASLGDLNSILDGINGEVI